MDEMFKLVRGCFGFDQEFAEVLLRSMYLKEKAIADSAEEEKDDKSGSVYFLWDDGLCKIGMSNSLKTRISMLSCGNPNIKLIGHIPSDNMCILEKRLHERYSKKRHKGEWFRITLKEARSTIVEFDGVVNRILLT